MKFYNSCLLSNAPLIGTYAHSLDAYITEQLYYTCKGHKTPEIEEFSLKNAPYDQTHIHARLTLFALVVVDRENPTRFWYAITHRSTPRPMNQQRFYIRNCKDYSAIVNDASALHQTFESKFGSEVGVARSNQSQIVPSVVSRQLS